jgi:hydrogenase maturation protease
MKSKVLVAGIGNIFLGDDAFGVEVASRLLKRPLPDSVKVKDFGIRSYDLAYALMEQWDLIILIDAIARGEAPGTLYTLEPELSVDPEISVEFDSHTMNPVSVIGLVRMMGGSVGHLLIVGCEPSTVELNEEGHLGLSAPVEAAVEEAVHIVEDLIIRTLNAATAAQRDGRTKCQPENY